MHRENMFHKSSVKICFTVLIILSVLSLNAIAGNLKSITVAGITDKKPLEFKLSKSSPSGIYVELWKIWSKKTGISVNYIITTADEAERGLKNGTVDVIMGYAPGSENSQFFIIKDIYLSGIYIYRNENVLSAEKISELPPYKVGVASDLASKIEKNGHEILFYIKKTIPELLKASEQGEINVFIAEDSLANQELRESGLWRKFIQSSEPVFKYGVNAALRADDKELPDLINSGFGRITETEKFVAERTWAGCFRSQLLLDSVPTHGITNASGNRILFRNSHH